MATPPAPEGKATDNQHAKPAFATNRSRWATRKLTIKSSKVKRHSLLGRMQGKKTSTEKKRASGGSESLRQPQNPQDNQPAAADEEEDDDEGPGPRTLYFNLPLPDDLRDQDGAPTQHFARNKIRTAKYTPLSFVPKNLYYQFQNVANIFFLFLCILNVSRARPPPAGLPEPDS